VKLDQQKLSNYYAEVTPSMGMHLISANIIDPFWKLRWCRKWDHQMDITPEDKTSYPTQYQQALLHYVEDEYCDNHRRVPVQKPESVPSSNHVPSTMATGSSQSSFDPCQVSSDDEDYLTPHNVAEMVPRKSDRAACILTVARLHLNSLPEAPKNWLHINSNLNDYHSGQMEISITFVVPDITDWWAQQETTHSMYTDLSNVVHDIFSIIPHGVGVVARVSLGRDIIRWSQSNTARETHCKIVIPRQFTGANYRILAGGDPALDTTNTETTSEIKLEAEERK
jgi:hypothetical protein